MAFRMTCTTQVCTTVWGNAVVIASGSPDSPSQQQIRMSRSPRLRSSVSTESHNFAEAHMFVRTCAR